MKIFRKKQQPSEEQTKPVFFQYRDKGELPELAKPPEAENLFKGAILETPKTQGKRKLFEVVEIEEREDGLIAYCESITPKYFNHVILVLVLAGTWFAIQYLLSLVGIGG